MWLKTSRGRLVFASHSFVIGSKSPATFLQIRGQFNKTFTRVTYSVAIVLESENNSYTFKLHL